MRAFILLAAVVGQDPSHPFHVLEGYDDVARNLAWQPIVHNRPQKPRLFEYTRTQKPLLEAPHSHPQDPCQVLANANVRSIAFYGDSYLRHTYQATARLLTGNYKDATSGKNSSNLVRKGFLRKGVDPASTFLYPDYGCDYEAEFLDGHCRGTIVKSVDVCSSFVTLYLHEMHEPTARPSSADVELYDVLVWGFGNHPTVTDHTRDISRFSSRMLSNDILKPTCRCEPFVDGNISKDLRARLSALKSMTGFAWTATGPGDDCIPWHASPKVASTVIWLQPHYRPMPGKGPEGRESTYRYSREMPVLVKEICGVVHILEPFNLTRDLVIASMIKSDYNTTLSLWGEGRHYRSGGKYDHVSETNTRNYKVKLPSPHDMSTPPYNFTLCVNGCFDMQRDPAHWGMGVNLIKADMIINEIALMKM
jgi:hypothetical protein